MPDHTKQQERELVLGLRRVLPIFIARRREGVKGDDDVHNIRNTEQIILFYETYKELKPPQVQLAKKLIERANERQKV